MRVDTSRSLYSQSATASQEFNRTELRNCKNLLRRLQFLEAKTQDPSGAPGSTAFVHMEHEMLSLEWILTEVGYLDVKERVSGNHKR